MTGNPIPRLSASRETDHTDLLISAVSDEHRRQVLGECRAAGVVEIDGLVESLVDVETMPDDPERLAMRLHHVTLPQLAETGVIEYDGRSNTARFSESPRSEQVFELLDAVDSLG